MSEDVHVPPRTYRFYADDQITFTQLRRAHGLKSRDLFAKMLRAYIVLYGEKPRDAEATQNGK